MLAYQPQTGYALAQAAIELARDVGDVEIEAHSLVTLGCARVSLGDADGVRDIERALELVGRRGTVAGRALTNLGWAYSVIGDFRETVRVSELSVEHAKEDGDVQSEWFARGNLAANYFGVGRWEEALALIELFDDAPAAAQYQRFLVRGVHTLILAARGDMERALEESRGVLAALRGMTDPQALWPSLVAHARLCQQAGRDGDAVVALRELLDDVLAHESVGDTQDWHVAMIDSLVEAGFRAEADEIVRRLAAGPWRDAAAAVVAGSWADAADTLASTGEQMLQAQMRMRAARSLLDEGRVAEGLQQLERARVFWSSVDATAYLSEADELFAAAS